MTTRSISWPFRALVSGAAVVFALAGCDTMSSRDGDQAVCDPPTTHNLEAAFADARRDLSGECVEHFDDYVAALMATAEGDPAPDNKRRFSDFFLWAADEGIVSRRQAQLLFNRYFNVKFVSMMGDYNNCANTCPDRSRVISDLERELLAKEQGLLRVSRDQAAYYRADRLFQETQLVLEATCMACEAGR